MIKTKNPNPEKLAVVEVAEVEEEVIDLTVKLLTPENVSTDLDITTTIPFTLVT